MKKTLFILGLILSFAFLNAQNAVSYFSATDDNTSVVSKTIQTIPTDPATKYASPSAKGDDMVLWDNTNVNIATPPLRITSTYWAKSDNWAWAADDFEADGPWIIKKIYSKGVYPDDPVAGQGEPQPTDQMMVVIYSHNDTVPGLEIYRSPAIHVEDALNPEIVLPVPFELPGAGRYWITVAGYYNTDCTSNEEVRWNRWSVLRGSTPIGLNLRFYDKMVIFTGNLPDTWMNQGEFSMYFKIEGDPNIPLDCETVTDLEAKYVNCEKVELTWKAPADGGSQYIIYRDGDEIDMVETESYTDIAFEPTLDHAWDVKVVCDGYSPPKRVTLLLCKEPDCPLKPKNLVVTVTEFDDHCEAALEWHKPVDVLWDNTAGTNSGYKSMRWMMEEFTRHIVADDFVVPSGETWYISEVYLGGFYISSNYPYLCPDFLGIEIYKDEGGLPGAQIYEDTFLTTVSGSFEREQTVLLPEPIVISEPGKYWLSFYGVYDADFHEDRTYFAYAHTESIGAHMVWWNEYEGGSWDEFNSELPSLYFRIQGLKSPTPIFYNIYRDGKLIATDVAELTYKDSEYDATKKHTWAVKMICPDGGVSAPVLATVKNCKEEVGISENFADFFTIFPNPSTGFITIVAESAINKIEVINFLGQTVFSQSNIYLSEKIIDLSYLHNGVYFIRVTSEIGTSIQKFVKQ